MKSYVGILALILLILILPLLVAWDQPTKKRQSIESVPQNAIELGRKLFFDPILSIDSSVSCASCHQPLHGFADTTRFSEGVRDRLTMRNTPTVKNVLARKLFFWDGRASTLEEQTLMPIENEDEMALPLSMAYDRLNRHPIYRTAFISIFNQPANRQTLSNAIAAYERTMESAFTPFDLFAQGDTTAISLEAKRGLDLFLGKANCFECHFGPDFSFDELINIGLYDGKVLNDKGLFDVTKDFKDIGKFKVPVLRNVENTAPYMHNGMFKSLREVIVYYNDPLKAVPGALYIDPRLKMPLNLTESEMNDLEAFLKTLTDPENE